MYIWNEMSFAVEICEMGYWIVLWWRIKINIMLMTWLFPITDHAISPSFVLNGMILHLLCHFAEFWNCVQTGFDRDGGVYHPEFSNRVEIQGGKKLQKREDYSVSDKLKIIDHIKNGITKSSISQEYGIPGRTIRG